MGSLNTVLVLVAVTDPAVVLAVWALACLAVLAAGLGVAWAVQIQGDGDPFARRIQPGIGNLSARHAADTTDAADDRRDHAPAHTAAAVALRRAAEAAAAVAPCGRHHTGDRRWSGNLIERTQAGTLTVDDLAEAMTAGAR